MSDIVNRLQKIVDNEMFMLGGEADILNVALSEIKKFRNALQWYADPANHQPIRTVVSGGPDDGTVLVEEPPIAFDGGERAREALEGGV